MKLTQLEYDKILTNINLPLSLKSQLEKETSPEYWTFVGTDFGGQ